MGMIPEWAAGTVLGALLGAILTVLVTYWFESRKEHKRLRESVYIPIYDELNQAVYKIVGLDVWIPRRVWAELNINYKVWLIKQPLRAFLQELYDDISNLSASINRMHEIMSEKTADLLKLSTIAKNNGVVQDYIRRHLVTELIYPMTTQEIGYLESEFSRFKEQADIKFKSMHELIKLIKPQIQADPFVKHVLKDRDRVLRKTQDALARVGKLIGEKNSRAVLVE